MTLQVDDYLAWTPADMEQGAVWLTLKATDMEMAASAVRNAAADAGQWASSKAREWFDNAN